MPDNPPTPPDETAAFAAFTYGRKQSELMEAISQRLAEAVDAKRSKMIAAENALSYRHGSEWSVSHSPEAKEFSRFSKISAMASVRFQDIADHKISAIGKYVTTMAGEFDRGFTSSIYELINETTDKTGNVVQFGGNIADDLVNVFTKIEFGCDRYGRPTMPSLHTSPQNADRIFRELQSQPKEYEERLAELFALKERDSTGREADRISKFRW